MPLFFSKWIFGLLLLVNNTARHPIYVSVLEINHNAKEKALEITCRIFTDDFEKQLRSLHNGKIDLLDNRQHEAMNPFVQAYVLNHLKISVDGKAIQPVFQGFESREEAIYSYWEAGNIVAPRQFNIEDDILFEYKSEQMNIVHVIVNGERKSTRLLNPDKKAIIRF
jgi:hypothetical protein